ncbi:MAG: DNA gyrase inhibitor YacG [Pseudohongiellaceae bacterium]|nr:DNA gyrase inhibitor YacG [Pseudohongiellaceae bacterium]
MTSKSKLKVNCPQCEEIVPWTEESKYRPFCSERCKLIDFGDWASERHSIPGEPVNKYPDDEDEF